MRRFAELGAENAFCKPLAENDNSKQQIYLGGSLEILQDFRFREVIATEAGRNSTYKAKLDFFWVGKDFTERADGAQLILYPQYPEVRLSGFLRGCKQAPSELLRPVPKEQRRFNNGPDGRVMFFGITKDGSTLVYLAEAESPLAQEFRSKNLEGLFPKSSVFFRLSVQGRDTKTILLARLAEIRDHGWHPSTRMARPGVIEPYKALSAGGTTLEALLGIPQNSSTGPDFMGWEIKAYGSGKVTLMTPQPDSGFYLDAGAEAFVRRFGALSGDDKLYFTGTHRVGTRCAKTGLTTMLRGYDAAKHRITDVAGAVALLTDAGECAAAWSFGGLLAHWNLKHAQAAYVPYEKHPEGLSEYRYFSPALLGEGTDFLRYLATLNAGKVIYDPGVKVEHASTAKPKVQHRNQFRVSVRDLSMLYQTFGPAEF